MCLYQVWVQEVAAAEEDPIKLEGALKKNPEAIPYVSLLNLRKQPRHKVRVCGSLIEVQENRIYPL